MSRESANSARSAQSSVHSVTAKAAAREELERDVEAFINKGGSVEQVPRSYRADPPKKPENNYGRGSI